MAEYVGIDFGTSNSVVACYGRPPRVLAKLPSVLQGEGGRVCWVKRALGTSETISFRGEVLSPQEVAGSILRQLKNVSQAELGEAITQAVITVPANAKGRQRVATKLAAQMAGIRALTLINEPTAAAMAYGIDLSQEQILLVYDLGGGTFDLTLLRVHNGIFEELASGGIGQLGGMDLDRRLAEHLYPGEVSPEILAVCEEAKIALSASEQAQVGDVVITRELFEGRIRDLVEETRGPIQRVLTDAQIRAEQVDQVLMVGGCSLIPLVREFVRGIFGQVAGGVNPMTCVAQGAAIASALFQNAPGLEEYAYSLKLEHSLCLEIQEGERLQLTPVIPRGREMPCAQREVYLPAQDYAPQVRILVYEGDAYHNPDDPANLQLAELVLPLDPPRPREEAPIQVEFSYGEDGILKVEAVDLSSGRTLLHQVQYGLEEW